MYEPIVTDPPHRAADGMVHFTVEFRGAGLETVKREGFTDTFTKDWFNVWCKRQADALNAPQEINAVSTGKVDLTGVIATDPVDEAREAYRDDLQLIGRLNWIRDNFNADITETGIYTECIARLKKSYNEDYIDLIPR